MSRLTSAGVMYLNPLFGGAFILTKPPPLLQPSGLRQSVSIPCLAGHSFSLKSKSRNLCIGGFRSQSPVWRGIHSHVVCNVDECSHGSMVSLNPLFGGAFILTEPSSRRSPTSIKSSLNPLFGGAFILTMSGRSADQAAIGVGLNPLFGGAFILTALSRAYVTEPMSEVSIPCLAGHSFSPRGRRHRRQRCTPSRLNPLFGGAFILTSIRVAISPAPSKDRVSIPCLAGHSFSQCNEQTLSRIRDWVSQSPVGGGIHSHNAMNRRYREYAIGCLNPLFGGAFILTLGAGTGAPRPEPFVVSIPCLAGHSFSHGKPDAPCSARQPTCVSIPCLAGAFILTRRGACSSAWRPTPGLNPLFGGAFILTRIGKETGKETEMKVSIPCLAGHSFSH